MWEYQVRNFEAANAEEWLNAAGDLGWELVHFHTYEVPAQPESSTPAALWAEVVMKKPKAE